MEEVAVSLGSKTWIRVYGQFEAIHCWPKAPKSERYLAHPHRHLFCVELRIEVYHNDRDLEFYAVKKWLTSTLLTMSKPLKTSCEMYAEKIAILFERKYGVGRSLVVCVSEDGLEGVIYEHY